MKVTRLHTIELNPETGLYYQHLKLELTEREMGVIFDATSRQADKADCGGPYSVVDVLVRPALLLWLTTLEEMGLLAAKERKEGKQG